MMNSLYSWRRQWNKSWEGWRDDWVRWWREEAWRKLLLHGYVLRAWDVRKDLWLKQNVNEVMGQHVSTITQVMWDEYKGYLNNNTCKMRTRSIEEITHIYIIPHLSVFKNKGWKFLKKLWCCVGGGNKVIWLYQLSWKCKLATVTCYKADVSSVRFALAKG